MRKPKEVRERREKLEFWDLLEREKLEKIMRDIVRLYEEVGGRRWWFWWSWNF